MSQCHERFYKKIRINLTIENLSLDEAAAIAEFFRELKEARAVRHKDSVSA